MKLIGIENPLPKEIVEQLDGYFNEKFNCSCGAIFETNVLDVAIEYEHSDSYKATVVCPLCGLVHRLGYYNLFKRDLDNIKTYKRYLVSKNRFDEMGLK